MISRLLLVRLGRYIQNKLNMRLNETDLVTDHLIQMMTSFNSRFEFSFSISLSIDIEASTAEKRHFSIYPKIVTERR